uniref:DNA-binding protein HU-beta n=1 Tax=Candidatus Williamhamiltonella sp. TaxID=2041084 RepID=A0A345X132_9ENTR|nr:DNA-binding protein [Candidatus Hamiltonella sp.]AXK15436.1 DNA-binding protein [Candidatus Hamiltonella sp.]AXK15448.1 DNA-binding protein [Candidatus Hamiltonella sp.]
MNKTELIGEIAENAGITKAKAKLVLDTLLKRITESLKNHESVQLMGFGTFKIKPRKARNARNPKTGEPMKIPACDVPTLSFGKFLKNELKGSQSVEKKTRSVAPVGKKQKTAAK